MSFNDYIDLLPVLNPSIVLDESSKSKLLRHFLRDEGQRKFDDLNLQTCSAVQFALNTLDRTVGPQLNVFTARLRFSRVIQENGELLKQFVSRLNRAVRFCEYSKLPQKKLEGSMFIHKFISGIKDDRFRESLFIEDADRMTWEKA
ncbi:unnamed protein product [Echinostoma caproni]|uniref:Uncharacterized protein n=1 Tax=Echinostoma caproni TaxID=27848 RepID=A0A183BA57_9TREM|nr:unnamed protein product [Echinostoma caproni]